MYVTSVDLQGGYNHENHQVMNLKKCLMSEVLTTKYHII